MAGEKFYLRTVLTVNELRVDQHALDSQIDVVTRTDEALAEDREYWMKHGAEKVLYFDLCQPK